MYFLIEYSALPPTTPYPIELVYPHGRIKDVSVQKRGKYDYCADFLVLIQRREKSIS
jgi:hypothetical protein